MRYDVPHTFSKSKCKCASEIGSISTTGELKTLSQRKTNALK